MKRVDHKRQVLATALRDLSVAAALYEQNPTSEHRDRLNEINDQVEALLMEFVEDEGDILPRPLKWRSSQGEG